MEMIFLIFLVSFFTPFCIYTIAEGHGFMKWYSVFALTFMFLVTEFLILSVCL